VVQQQPGERGTRELRALIGVHDCGTVVARDRLLDSGDAHLQDQGSDAPPSDAGIVLAQRLTNAA
jgi:hypothetical protein